MEKMFIYEVNGTELEDTVAFGKAWEKAKELATEMHCGITRTVISRNKISYEFYANGVFLEERFYSPEKIKIF